MGMTWGALMHEQVKGMHTELASVAVAQMRARAHDHARTHMHGRAQEHGHGHIRRTKRKKRAKSFFSLAACETIIKYGTKREKIEATAKHRHGAT